MVSGVRIDSSRSGWPSAAIDHGLADGMAVGDVAQGRRCLLERKRGANVRTGSVPTVAGPSSSASFRVELGVLVGAEIAALESRSR